MSLINIFFRMAIATLHYTYERRTLNMDALLNLPGIRNVTWFQLETKRN